MNVTQEGRIIVHALRRIVQLLAKNETYAGKLGCERRASDPAPMRWHNTLEGDFPTDMEK